MKNLSSHTPPFPMPDLTSPKFPDCEVSCADFPSIQAAVDHCAALGGGTVTVPAGEWHCAALHLRNDLHLHFSDGAVLHFSDEPADYLPVVFTRWEGTECYNYSPLIYANGCKNLAVTGRGTLMGHGQRWWGWKKLQQDAAKRLGYSEFNKIPPSERIFGTPEDALRPSFLQFIQCENILLDGLTFIDGPQWTIHPVYCSDVIIRNCQVRTCGPNTDGLNPDSCRNVLIENCSFHTGDDCIAVNAGLNEDGWRVNRPCENIVIRNCTMTGGHGGVVIGSAVSGSVRNVYACDCKITGTAQGIRLKSMRGRGGTVENILFEDISLNDIELDAIHINMFYDASTIEPKTDTPSVFRNITVRNVSGKGAKTAVFLRGFPEQKLQNIRLENIDLTAENSMLCSDVSGLCLEQVRLAE